VLQDGRDLASVVSVRQSWGALAQPLEDLERIEIIRGPGSALYGPNAYNGVISITTPAARDVVGTKLTLGGGELSTVRADLRHAGVWFHQRLGYRVNLGYRRSADWAKSRTARDGSDWKEEYAAATVTPPTSPGPESLPLAGQTKDPVTGRALGTPDPVVSRYGSARADYYAPSGSIATLEGGVAREDNAVYISNRARTQIPRFLRPWARLAWNTGGTGLSAWYSGFSLQGGLVSLTSGAPSYNDEAVFHLEGHTSFQFAGDAGRGVVGASIQDNAVNTKGTLLGLASDDRSDQYYGAFAQVEYTLGRVRLIGATRWDDSNLFPTQLSPKIGVVFAPTANHALRLTVNRAFLTPGMGSLFLAASAGPGVENLLPTENQLRADATIGPALADVPVGKLFTNSVAVPESALGNPRLRPQTVMSYEAGYKGQLGRRFFVTLDLYRAHMRDFLTDQLPAGTTGVNPVFQPWTAPSEVPAAARAQVEAAVLAALAARSSRIRNGLTRLADGTTAVVFSWGNAGVVDEWGVELGTSLSLANAWTLGATYSWFDSDVSQNPTALNVLSPNTPRHKGTATLEYAGRQGITVAVDARIVAGYHWASGIWDGDVPASQTVNLNAAYRLSPHLRTYVIATNLLDQRRFQFYGASVIRRRVLGGLTATF
jgi:iron complex outermembrane receptor protein